MMNLNNIKGMIDLQFGATNPELVTEREGVKFFKAIDNVFMDAVEIRVSTADNVNYSVYKRFHIEGVDIDVTIPGVSDEYTFLGHLMQPLTAEIISA